MAIEIMPRVGIQPVRSQTGGVDGRVVPMRDATGAQLQQIGEGMQDLGRATTALADQHQDNVDLAMSQRMRNLFDADHEKELRDPQAGFLTTLGMDASEARWKQSSERLRGQRTKIEKMAQNEAQRRNFAEFADRRDSETTATARIHQIREGKTFRAGETKAAVDRGIDRAIRLTTSASQAAAQAADTQADPMVRAAASMAAGTMRHETDVAIAEAMRDIDTYADLVGMPKDSAQRASLKRGATDSLHVGIVNGFLAEQNTPMANVYLRQHKGEMSAEVAVKAQDDVDRANSIAVKSGRDAVAWQVASKMHGTGDSLPVQRARLDAFVRESGMPVEVAMKTWDMLKDLDTQNYQQIQRDRSEAKQSLEQAFAKNPDLSVDGLGAEELQRIDDLGLRGDAFKIHNEVRLKRLADQVGDGSLDSLVLARDMRSIGEMRQMVDFLSQRSSSIIGKEAETMAGKEKKARLDAVIKKTQEDIEALLMRPRTFVTPDDLPTPMPNSASGAPAQPPIDMKKFADEIRKALYPGSGR